MRKYRVRRIYSSYVMMDKFKWCLNYAVQKRVRPPFIFEIVASFFDLVMRFATLDNGRLSLKRFFKTNRIPFENDRSNSDEGLGLEILFVSTQKDFQLLPLAIEFALNATSNFSVLSITVITPDKYVSEVKNLVRDCEVTVEGESLYFYEDTLRKLRNTFAGRFGWVLQQLLKLQFVLSSKASGVLIIDSDTILLEKRKWLGNDGSQLLTPTWEYHKPYYEFLDSIGICEINPEYTFVSHHMLMQPKIVNELFEYVGWKDIADLIEFISSMSIGDEQSPFSLDYELYAQYLYKNYPGNVVLGKWSNKAVARDSGTDDINLEISKESLKNSNRFASLSFHSYLKAKAP